MSCERIGGKSSVIPFSMNSFGNPLNSSVIEPMECGRDSRHLDLEIFPLGYIILAWHDRPRLRTLSTRSPNRGGGRFWTCSPRASGRSTTWSARSAWPSRRSPSTCAVLREVGLVSVRGVGQQRLYRLNAERLKVIFDWVRVFEPFWDHQLERIKQSAERKAREREVGQDTSKERG